MRFFVYSRRTIMMLAVLLLMMPTAGCLFAPRDPEEPQTGAQIEYLVQRDATNVWANMQTALNAQDIAGWEEQLSPDFICVDETQGNDAWWEANWNNEREVEFATSFFTQVSAVESNLRHVDDEVDEPTGEGDWVIVYRITVTEADDSETIYCAQARITFKLEGSFWYIIRWVDEQAEEFGQTLGVLRIALASK